MNLEEPDPVDTIHRAGNFLTNVRVSGSVHGSAGSGQTDFKAAEGAIVTGAGRGIGLAFAEAFARDDPRVVIAERDPESGTAAAQ